MKMMKLGSLLALSVCFAGISFAQDARTDSLRKDSPRRASSRNDSFRAKSNPPPDFSAAHVADGAEDRLVLSMNMKPDAPDSLDDGNANSCAYMRTYRVKRQARGSDAVTPAGYTTCVPTRRFEMRSAVETRTDSGAGEK